MRACGGTGPNGFDRAVEQLRSAVGAWEVKTTQYGDDGHAGGLRFRKPARNYVPLT